MVFLYSLPCLVPEARRLAHRLEHEVGGELPLNWDEFLLDSLDDSAAFQVAVEAATGARVILIAICGYEPPPPRMLEWLEAVRRRAPAGERALVALLGCRGPAERREGAAAEVPLRAAAERLGADYFHHQILICPPCWRAAHAVLQQRAQMLSPLLADIFACHEPAAKTDVKVKAGGP